MSRPKILVAPLDWGLGHATRCVPIVNELQKLGAIPLLATNSPASAYLKSRFPDLLHLEPPPYNIEYRAGRAFLDILLQTPRILRTIEAENLWLQKTIASTGIDAVISDNRYGMYGPIPSVIVTHQTSPTGPRILQKKLRNMVTKHLGNFDECWIPDTPSSTFSGQLSDTASVPVAHSSIGPLSRLEKPSDVADNQLIGIVSGPENQRTDFEIELRDFLLKLGSRAVLICGKPHEEREEIIDNLTIYNHLPDADFARVVTSASHIFCRSGYSTIMDLAKLNLRANLIPTKGQSEQEYLARHLESSQGWKHFVRVADIELDQCVTASSAPSEHQFDPQRLQRVLHEFLTKIDHG